MIPFLFTRRNVKIRVIKASLHTQFQKLLAGIHHIALLLVRHCTVRRLIRSSPLAQHIGLVNEMKIVADKMEIDIHEVVDAAATKPFGFTPYYPGPGLGGHCIPIDPFYLTWKAREYGVHTRFIELSGEVNASMPDYVIEKLMYGLNDHGIALKNAKILILGLAYKKNVDDERESPCIEILDKLIKMGSDVSYSDPHIPEFKKKRDYHYDLNSVDITAQSLAQYDAVVLATNHDRFDYDLILNNSRLIIDTRGQYRDKNDKVIRA